MEEGGTYSLRVLLLQILAQTVGTGASVLGRLHQRGLLPARKHSFLHAASLWSSKTSKELSGRNFSETVLGTLATCYHELETETMLCSGEVRNFPGQQVREKLLLLVLKKKKKKTLIKCF